MRIGRRSVREQAQDSGWDAPGVPEARQAGAADASRTNPAHAPPVGRLSRLSAKQRSVNVRPAAEDAPAAAARAALLNGAGRVTKRRGPRY